MNISGHECLTEDCSSVDSGGGTDTTIGRNTRLHFEAFGQHFTLELGTLQASYLKKPVHTTDRELKTSAAGTRRGLLLVKELLVNAHGALGTLSCVFKVSRDGLLNVAA